MKQLILIFCFYISCLQPKLLIKNNGPCMCDITSNKCDRDCCCDLNCTETEILSFKCNYDQISPRSFGCLPRELMFHNNIAYLNVTMENQYCVYQDDYELRNFYVAPLALTSTEMSTMTVNNIMPAIATVYDATSVFSRQLYVVGDSVPTVVNSFSIGFLGLSRPNRDGLCVDGLPIGYLINEVVSCTRLFDISAKDCSSLPSTSFYHASGMLVPSTPVSMLSRLTSLTPGTDFSNVTCHGCHVNELPAYDTQLHCCTNVVTELKYDIYGESNITSVVITPTYGNVSTSFSQRFSVTFIKDGYSTKGSARSGNPGYIVGHPLKCTDDRGTVKDMMMISGGDCGNGTRAPILFGMNTHSDCIVNTSQLGAYVNATLLSLLPKYITSYGDLSLDSLVPRTTVDDVPLSPRHAISGLTVYVVYARTGTLTAPQNKVIGYQTTFSYDHVDDLSQLHWVTVSLKFVDNSITAFNLKREVARRRASNTVNDFLRLLHSENDAVIAALSRVTAIIGLATLFLVHTDLLL